MTHFLSALGRIYNFLISLIVAVILVVSSWVSWQYYQEALRQDEFVQAGKLVSVRVNSADHQQRSWRDSMGNVVYLLFDYEGKTYTSRYTMNKTYIGQGDRVTLLYHPGYDAFHQPDSEVKFARSIRKSRLIGWTTIRDFTDQNRLLLLCLVLTTAALFMSAGVIKTVIAVPFLTEIARFIFVFELVVAAFFFTYDVWMYFSYYQHIKSTGQPIRVLLIDTDRIAHGRGRTTNWYDYQATIHVKQQERVIPISENDYTSFKTGDLLPALFDDSVDDLMSADYRPNYLLIILPLFFWLLSYLFIRPVLSRRKKVQI